MQTERHTNVEDNDTEHNGFFNQILPCKVLLTFIQTMN